MCTDYERNHITDSCAMLNSLAAERCDSESGMDDPDKVPEDKWDTPATSTGSPVDDSNPLNIPADEPDKEVELGFGSEQFPDDTPVVDRIEPKVTENVKKVQYYYLPEGATEYVPFDEDGDGVADVRSISFPNLKFDAHKQE